MPRDTTTEGSYRDRFRWDSVTYGTHCANCLSTCSYRVYARDGEVVWEEQSGAFPQTEAGVPDRNPMGCQKGAAWSLQRRAGDRLTHPMRRVGDRGSGAWETITWEEALTEIADAILDTIEEFGTESVVIDEGPEGGMLTIVGYMRFGAMLGAVSLDGNATVNDFPAGHYLTFGTMAGGSAAEDSAHADVILIWHANPAYTRIPYFHFLTEARYAGATVVLIAPDFSPSAPHADIFVPVEPGSDAALALAMCKVVVDEGLFNEEFVCSQTDLALLVRCDTGRLLREQDLVDGGRDDAFYRWDSIAGDIAMVDPGYLSHVPGTALGGRFEIEVVSETPDGIRATAEVTPVFELLRERLDEYTPETAHGMCGVHPETIRMLARKIAGGKTKLHEGFDTAKHYHGDLMERAMDLLLALTANWGAQGNGFDTFCTFPFDGAYVLSLKSGPGMEAAEQVIAGSNAMFGRIPDDGSAPPPIPRPGVWQFMSMAALAGSTTPPFWFWAQHCGYEEMWSKSEWGASPRPFSEYLEEAREAWAPLARPQADKPPRVLIEMGTNALRRTRGGGRMLRENLWPKLKMIVSVDPRMNTAGMQADILLPAAHEAERANIQYPVSHSMEMAFSDKAVEPLGEARSDWQILASLAEAISDRAVARDMGDMLVGRAGAVPLSEIGAKFRIHPTLATDEAVIDEMVRDTALSGVIHEDTTLATLRETGWASIRGNGSFPSGRVAGGAISEERTFSGFSWHVQEGLPYVTLTGRATFYVDHPWFLEAGEHLPCHKPPPATGGDLPFSLTGGHPRWSIHACNATNPLMLETTRGHPTVVINSADAASREIADGDLVEVANELGRFSIAVRLSESVRPGQAILYASWEPYGFESWKDGTQVEAGMVKWLHLATGWGHLLYTPLQWQPTPFDRCTRVDIRRI